MEEEAGAAWTKTKGQEWPHCASVHQHGGHVKQTTHTHTQRTVFKLYIFKRLSVSYCLVLKLEPGGINNSQMN